MGWVGRLEDRSLVAAVLIVLTIVAFPIGGIIGSVRSFGPDPDVTAEES